MSERIDEGTIIGAVDYLTIKQMEHITLQMQKSICKIQGKLTGTGFFCHINYDNKRVPCLMTNFHILDKEYIIQKKNKIEISINDNKIIEEIIIKPEDVIYSSKRNEYDLVIIKLKEGQEYMKNVNYLELDENLFIKNSLKGYKSIYILHYPNSQNAAVSYGNGITFDENKSKFDIQHKCNTLEGSSGGPILNLSTNKVIGIHKGCIQKISGEKYNIGSFLKEPLEEIKNKNSEDDINIDIFSNNDPSPSKLFYILDDINNRKECLALYKKIMYYYNNQSELNYNKAMNELNKNINNIKEYFEKNKDKIPLFSRLNNFKFLNMLKLFENLEQNYKKIIREFTNENGFHFFYDYIFCERNGFLFDKFIYFIAGFLKALDMAGNDLAIKRNCAIYGMDNPFIPYDELIIFKKNIGKLISFKHIMSTTLDKRISLNFQRSGTNIYKIIIKINYEFNPEYGFDCVDISNLSTYASEKEILFRYFSIFRIDNVKMDENNKIAEIELNSIKIGKDFESQIKNLFE